MSTTRAQTVERAMRELRPVPTDTEKALIREQLTVILDPTLERFAQIIVKDPRKREYLRPLNPLAVSSVAGVADLSTLVETNGLLMDFPEAWDVRLAPD